MIINKRNVILGLIINIIFILSPILFLISSFSIYKLENRENYPLSSANIVMSQSFGVYAKRLDSQKKNTNEIITKKELSDRYIFSSFFDEVKKREFFLNSINQMDQFIYVNNLKNKVINFNLNLANYYLVNSKLNQEEILNLISKLNLYFVYKSNNYQIDKIRNVKNREVYSIKGISCGDFQLKKKIVIIKNCSFTLKLPLDDGGVDRYIKEERFTSERYIKKLEIFYNSLYRYVRVDYFKFIIDFLIVNYIFLLSILIFLNFLTYYIILNLKNFFNEKI